MISKSKESKLLFTFENTDAYFEMGYLILEQEQYVHMMEYARTEYRGIERYVVDTQKYVPLEQALIDFTEQDIIDLLYTMVYMVQQVEENGLLRRECLWYHYEHMYYDMQENRPKFIVFPVCGEIQYGSTGNWKARFEKAVVQIIQRLSEKKSNAVRQIMISFIDEILDTEKAMEQLNALGTGQSEVLVDKTLPLVDTKLILLYCGKEGTVQFEIEGEEFLIGKNPKAVDGVLQVSKVVSRIHCKIMKKNRKFFVQDMNSVNHTFVNGEYIPSYEVMELLDGDVLTLADVDLRVRLIEKEK